MAPDTNSSKRCPHCGGEIDYFGSCKRCGREWSEHLEEGEQAKGLPEGKEHQSEFIPKKIGTHVPRKTKFTKSGAELTGKEFVTFVPEVPQKYAGWMIDVDHDGDVEIINKRSLMRLESRKIYNAMGLSARAHDAQKGALLWITRLWDFLSEEERKALAPTVERLKQSFQDLRRVAVAKQAEAAEMEVILEKAHKQARRARLRQMDEARKQAAVEIVPGEDTEGYSNPEPLAIDPEHLSREELIELAKERLASIDEEKRAAKKKATSPFRDPTEETEESE